MKKALTVFWTLFLISIMLCGAWVVYADIMAAVNLNATPVPEPVTILLIGAGLIAFVHLIKHLRSEQE